jgi:ElaB/YqjD/DUF883 family membrane-anchored ribosome-binding protein
MMERTAAQTAALAEELRNVMHQAEKLVVALSEDRDEALIELRERMSVALAEGKQRLADFEAQAGKTPGQRWEWARRSVSSWARG